MCWNFVEDRLGFDIQNMAEIAATGSPPKEELKVYLLDFMTHWEYFHLA